MLSKGKDDIVTRIMQSTEGGSGKSLIRLLIRGGSQSPEVAWIGMFKMKVVGIIAFWACFQGRA